MGRLVVEEAAEERGRSCGVEEEVGVFCAVVGMLALDLRLEPSPKPLKREFRELMWSRKRRQCDRARKKVLKRGGVRGAVVSNVDNLR